MTRDRFSPGSRSTADRVANAGGMLTDALGPWIRLGLFLGLLVVLFAGGMALFTYATRPGTDDSSKRAARESAERAERQKRAMDLATTGVDAALRSDNFDAAFEAISAPGIADQDRQALSQRVEGELAARRKTLLDEAERLSGEKRFDDARTKILQAKSISRRETPSLSIEAATGRLDAAELEATLEQIREAAQLHEWERALSHFDALEKLPGGSTAVSDLHREFRDQVKGRLQITGLREGAIVHILDKDYSADEAIWGLPVGQTDAEVSAPRCIPQRIRVDIKRYPEVTQAAVQLEEQMDGPAWTVAALRGRPGQHAALDWYVKQGGDAERLGRLPRKANPKPRKKLMTISLKSGEATLFAEAISSLPNDRRQIVMPDGTQRDVAAADILESRSATDAEAMVAWRPRLEQDVDAARKADDAAEVLDLLGSFILDFPESKDEVLADFEEALRESTAKLEEACPVCLGKRARTCSDCDGRKRRREEAPCTADGCVRGKKTCAVCDGKKRHDCDRCGGKGRIGTGDKSSVCSKCNGARVVPCQKCGRTGYVTCTKCRGTGKGMIDVPCPTCQARGRVPCDTCHQTGRRDRIVTDERIQMEAKIRERLK